MESVVSQGGEAWLSGRMCTDPMAAVGCGHPVSSVPPVSKALIHWTTQLSGKVVLVETDSTTVVSYIKRQGGTHSPDLCFRTWHLWKHCIQNDIFLILVHVPGVQNLEADALGRANISSAEWELIPRVTNHLFTHWEKPEIDLFATDKNKELNLCTNTPARSLPA